ncbi:MAG: roadblock/LC7 domain-containing protein [Candidatus Hodarchaeales archaeon]|jgi:predicted regulator of Ras-like GTPase activity (Roadblock/LC7/MglB family)
MDYLPLVQTILVKVLKSERLIQAVLLTDRTGLIILSVSKEQRVGAHALGMGSLASALFCGADAQGKDLLGNLEMSISEFIDGKIFLMGTGPKAIMVVISGKLASIKKIRRSMKRYSGNIQQLLASLYSVEEVDAEKGRYSAVLDLLDF